MVSTSIYENICLVGTPCTHPTSDPTLVRHTTENISSQKRSSFSCLRIKRLEACLLFVCCQASFCPQPASETHAVDYLAFTTYSFHASLHFAADLNARYIQEWRGHPSWNSLRAPGKRSQRKRQAFQLVSALRLGQEEKADRAHGILLEEVNPSLSS